MPTLNPALKKILEGLAYADLAEMMPTSAKQRSLAGNPAGTTLTAEATDVPAARNLGVLPQPRRIGLFLGPYATNALIEYAFDSATRLGTEIVVFTFLEKTRARRLLETFRPRVGGGSPVLQIEHLDGKPERALRKLQERGLRLEFLVCDERGYLGHQIAAGEIALDVPVVMVTPPQDIRKDRIREVPADPSLARS